MIRSLLIFIFFSVSAISNATEHKITASSWLVADGDGEILQSENMYEHRSIASITKLMTAMVVLDKHQDLDEYIKPYTRRELLQLAIVHSDNKASDLLCQRYPGGRSACVRAMNEKAHSLGMLHTSFVDPTGLGVMNASTAYDLIKMVRAAELYPEIVTASKMSEVKIRHKKKFVVFRNTNPIIGKRHEFIVSKTGYIRAAGGCIVMMLDTALGRRIVVLLGSKNTKTRIPEAELIALRT